MTCDTMLAKLRDLQETLKPWPSEACPADYDRPGMGRQLKHARWLLDHTIRGMEHNSASEQEAASCLGFVQCVLWTNGLKTMAEMAEGETGT